ncbi:DUF7146 domain-containing protein [Paracoccus yeei]|uniref:DUF7146 domain-containing protein n=1 Tax=Paracoccus yeei TaxID=147645 RepID=UPI0017496672|nr:toprim domain-containing protein [Paracoccus yeei]
MRAVEIVKALRGRPSRNGGLCFCPAHANTRTPALSVTDGIDGRLLLHCHAGCDYPSIMDALRGLGLVEGKGTYSPPSPAEMDAFREAERQEAEKRERQALFLWREAQPIAGTIAETYLRGRGITCDLPDTLRFHPASWHSSAQRLPAMAALIGGLPRLAVHRTYLRPDGSGKAEVTPAKAMLGAALGGAVRLTGTQGPLVVAEGIETALSLASGLLGRPATIWAALSASGIAGLRLPEANPHRLTIASDGDKAGREAAYKLAVRASAHGWTVSLLPAPEGRDWNDILNKKGAAI